jgi:hypothetical protein
MLQPLRSLCGQLVNANAAVCGRDAPFGFEQLFLEKPLEGGIQRAFFDLEEIVGRPLNVLDKSVTMEGLPLESSQNHHFESAGEEVTLFGFFHGQLPGEGGGYAPQGLEQNSVLELWRQEIFLGTDAAREGKLGSR